MNNNTYIERRIGGKKGGEYMFRCYKRRISLLLAFTLLCSTFLFGTYPVAQTTIEPQRLIEIIGLRDSSSKTYQLSDGTFEWVGYTEDIHYKDDYGNYCEVDNRIVCDKKKSRRC